MWTTLMYHVGCQGKGGTGKIHEVILVTFHLGTLAAYAFNQRFYHAYSVSTQLPKA